MSLVHQVLKNIDERSDQDIIVVPESLRFVEKKQQNNRIFLVSLTAVALILAVLTWWYSSQPDVEPSVSPKLADTAVLQNISATATATGEQIDVPEKNVTGNRAETDDQFDETLISATAVKTLADESVETAAAELIGADSPAKKTESPAIVRPAAEEGSHLIISQRDQQAQRDYTRMLSLMRNKQWHDAEVIAEQLLDQSGINQGLLQKLKHNKLRILLEQKRFESFLNFYNQYETSEDELWLSTAAPGLHMMGAYPQAIKSYRQLIAKQPQVVNWPIAMALALEQQGNFQQAEQVFQQIQTGYPLQAEQRRWVEAKLASLR